MSGNKHTVDGQKAVELANRLDRAHAEGKVGFSPTVEKHIETKGVCKEVQVSVIAGEIARGHMTDQTIEGKK